MRVLVVGGAGYIGSVTVDQLLQSGHTVTVLDSLVSGHREAVNADAELVVADARAEDALARLMASHSFEAVVYYGGFIQAGESVINPGRYFANNVAGCIALLNAMVAYGVGHFVFSSSAAVYGEPDEVPIREDAPLRPVNPYGEAKLIVERMLPWYEKQGMRYVSLRYFNAAGASDRRGEDHRPETHLIPIVLQVAAGQRDAVPLYGTDYATPDGTCIRDYVHVSDLAAAHILALESASGGDSGVYNLGNGTGFSNREVIEAAGRVTGKPIAVREEARRPGDPARLVASSERAKEALGWTPGFTELEAIVESAWRWHQAHPKGYST
ncbi:MAG TPA: UDP-glucose 4-epimerase GalE [Dehalococcoidia bacterium]|nr:UDP-glucose 4-epimerase GalE [Dehalococcoidia bacterium]